MYLYPESYCISAIMWLFIAIVHLLLFHMGIHSRFVFIMISVIFVKISAAPGVFIWHRGVLKYSVARIWAAPVVIGILGGRVPGVLQWIEDSLGNIAFLVAGVP